MESTFTVDSNLNRFDIVFIVLIEIDFWNSRVFTVSLEDADFTPRTEKKGGSWESGSKRWDCRFKMRFIPLWCFWNSCHHAIQIAEMGRRFQSLTFFTVFHNFIQIHWVSGVQNCCILHLLAIRLTSLVSRRFELLESTIFPIYYYSNIIKSQAIWFDYFLIGFCLLFSRRSRVFVWFACFRWFEIPSLLTSTDF